MDNTPSSRWAEAGKEDPHGTNYACKRSDLALGHLTDDELANKVFLHNHRELDLDAILAGEPSSIGLLTAAKDRIRWLSRQVEQVGYADLFWNDRPASGCLPAEQKWKAFQLLSYDADGQEVPPEHAVKYRILGVTPTVSYYLHTCHAYSEAVFRLNKLEVLLNV